MNSLLIVGAGSFSPEVDELAHLLGYTDTAFLDDNPDTAHCQPVIGTTADIERFRSQYDTAIVALGNNENRMKYHQVLKDCGYHIPTLIHPTAYISPDAEISPGCIIRAKVVVSRYVHIGEACILNVGALIDHHVEIGDGCHILMGAVVRNKAKVKPLTRVESLTLVEESSSANESSTCEMTEDVFINQYWKQYLMIEKEFKSTFKYIALHADNYSTFSDVYAKLLLQVGSEVDVIAKTICRIINNESDANNIGQYKGIIISSFPEFPSVTVVCDDITIKPWDGWTREVPVWWRIYNGVKHNRNKVETYDGDSLENYKFANQKTVLYALAGLYQEEIYLYSLLQHDSRLDTPMPGSRLFRLIDNGWDNKEFFKDSRLFVEDERLCYLTAGFLYSDV